MITECSSIQVLEGDILPKHICTKCVQDLNQAHGFRNLIIKSDLKLKKSFEAKKELYRDQNNSAEINEHCHICDEDEEKFEFKFNELSAEGVKEDEVSVKVMKWKKIINKKTSTLTVKNSTHTKSPPTPRPGASIGLSPSTGLHTVNVEGGLSSLIIEKFSSSWSINEIAASVETLILPDKLPIETTNQPEKLATQPEKLRNEPENLTTEDEKNNTEILSKPLKVTKDEKLIEQKRKKALLKCKQCNETFRSGYSLRRHNILHTGVLPYSCEFCNKGFPSRWGLTIHTRVHTGDKPLECDVCQKRFGMLESCRICLFVINEPQCINIFKKINDKSVLEIIKECSSIQVLEEDTLPKYICTKCAEDLNYVHEFRNLIIKSDLKLKQNVEKHLHKPAEESERHNESCDGDEEKFEIKDELNEVSIQGIVKEEEVSDVDFELTVTAERLTLTKESKKKNLKTVSNFLKSTKDVELTKRKKKRQVFHCCECDETFKSAYSFKSHNILHTGVQPFSCETCNKGFPTKWAFMIHTRVHTGDKPFACDVCEKKFGGSNYLVLRVEKLSETKHASRHI